MANEARRCLVNAKMSAVFKSTYISPLLALTFTIFLVAPPQEYALTWNIYVTF